MIRILAVLIFLGTGALSPHAVLAAGEELVVEEFVTASPLLADGRLYVGSFEHPGHGGHLRAYDLSRWSAVLLWDAAEQVPPAGVGLPPGHDGDNEAPLIIQENQVRNLWTNQGRSLFPFTRQNAARLQSALAVESVREAETLIQTVRGRTGVTPDVPEGTGEATQRLWGIRTSTPALVGPSPVIRLERERPTVLYVGADDGMLHAVLVSDDSGEISPGTELWAYLPETLLAHLQDQPFEAPSAPPAVQLDSSPAVADHFLDVDDDGLPEWRTLLVATGRVEPRELSLLFVLDVTDPFRPALLWEGWLPGRSTGRSRGAVSVQTETKTMVLFTATTLQENSGLAEGAQVCALDPVSGRLVWQFGTTVPDDVTALTQPPAVPTLMDLSGDGRNDHLVFGDLHGQLWVIDIETGTALGRGPLFRTPGGNAEPIGARVAVDGRTVVFGTGGAEHAEDDREYGLYAVEISSGGGRLLWRYPLERGEKVWSAPTLDRFGAIFFGTATGYRPGDLLTGHSTGGRSLVLGREGNLLQEETLESAVPGRVAVDSGLSITVTLHGESIQSGEVSPAVGATWSRLGPMRVFSWRIR